MALYRFTREAEEELRQIVRYIQKDKPDAALLFIGEVERVCDLLASMPTIGRSVAELSHLELQIHTAGKYQNYLIFYVPDETGIVVAHVVDGRRSLPSLFEEWW